MSEQRGLTQWQIFQLIQAIDPAHVESKRGLSYIAQHSARAVMTNIFGFGNWDTQVEEMTLLYETQLLQGHPQFPEKGKAKEYWVVAYRGAVRLNIRDYWGNPVASFLEYHAEENAPLPNRGEAHAMAVTSVESYAFRRAAFSLGDKLGLSLYNRGSVQPIVRWTAQLADPESPTYMEPPQQQQQQQQQSAHAQKSAESTPQMQKFKQTQEQMQQRREEQRDQSMTERLQNGMKLDGAQQNG